MQIDKDEEKKIIFNSLLLKHADVLNLINLQVYIEGVIDDWVVDLNEDIQDHPFSKYHEACSYYQKNNVIMNETILKEYSSFCKSYHYFFDESFWIKELNSDQKEKKIATDLLLRKWRNEINSSLIEWEKEHIRKMRSYLVDNLSELLKKIEPLDDDLLCELTDDSFSLIMMYIQSLHSKEKSRECAEIEGEYQESEIKKLLHYASYFENNEQAKKILEVLGRMCQANQSEKLDIAIKNQDTLEQHVDLNANDEIIGLKLSKELEYLLPSELALLSDKDMSILFDLKYLEEKLVQIELEGINYQNAQLETSCFISSLDKNEDAEEKNGPMILCVDTSSSMWGEPENIAKATALYLGKQAKLQKRACYIITFSTRIETFELINGINSADLLAFLRYSFNGGTDVVIALDHAITLLKEQTYKKADILVISDFLIGNLPTWLLQDMEEQRLIGTKFNAFIISSEAQGARYTTSFDYEWFYHTGNGTLQEVTQKNE